MGDGNKMRSQLDDRIAAAYKKHRRNGLLISGYAGVNATEFFAECGRAALNHGPERPPGRLSDRARLERIDPDLVALIDEFLNDARGLHAQTSMPIAS